MTYPLGNCLKTPSLHCGDSKNHTYLVIGSVATAALLIAAVILGVSRYQLIGGCLAVSVTGLLVFSVLVTSIRQFLRASPQSPTKSLIQTKTLTEDLYGYVPFNLKYVRTYYPKAYSDLLKKCNDSNYGSFHQGSEKILQDLHLFDSDNTIPEGVRVILNHSPYARSVR